MLARFGILFFVVIGFFLVPLFSYFMCRWLLPRRWGRKVGLALAVLVIGLVSYGMTYGFEQLEVRHIEYASKDLPEAFDGYRMLHFSDAHIATFEGSREWMLQRAVDSIKAQHADVILFTGDMQNLYPEELASRIPVIRQLKAPDGVFGILGNHDYATYIDCDGATKKRNNKKTVQLMREMGLTMLLNEHRMIRRDSDSIVIAGMENWGIPKRMPRKGDVHQTMKGVSPQSFTVMLEHDPSAWRKKILPQCHAQLTLSGHTHGGQFSLFGWSPVAFSYDDWCGMSQVGDRAIYVSAGLGGLIPFRIGQPAEITVITLRKK